MKLRKGDTKYISHVLFDDCKHDFMRVAHLFDMRIHQFVRVYGELKGCGAWAAKNYLSGPQYHHFQSTYRVLPYLSEDNKHLFVNTLVQSGKTHMINPLHVQSYGGNPRALEVAHFLMEKWQEIHQPIISRFSEILSSIGLGIQVPKQVPKHMQLILAIIGEADPAVLAHAMLESSSNRSRYVEFIPDVPIVVFELLGFSPRFRQGGGSR